MIDVSHASLAAIPPAAYLRISIPLLTLAFLAYIGFRNIPKTIRSTNNKSLKRLGYFAMIFMGIAVPAAIIFTIVAVTHYILYQTPL